MTLRQTKLSTGTQRSVADSAHTQQLQVNSGEEGNELGFLLHTHPAHHTNRPGRSGRRSGEQNERIVLSFF